MVYQVRIDFYLLNRNILFLLTDPLRFLVEPSNKTASVGDSVWFHCEATGSPKPRITWLKHGQGGRPLDEEKYKAHENGSLNIRDVQLSDRGSYFCIAATNVDLKQKTVHLEVKGKPAWSNSTRKVMRIDDRITSEVTPWLKTKFSQIYFI